MSTSKMQFSQGTEVGVVQEEGNADIAYAVMDGLSVSLTTRSSGQICVNIEAVDDIPVDAVVVRDGDTELATIQYGSPEPQGFQWILTPILDEDDNDPVIEIRHISEPVATNVGSYAAAAEWIDDYERER